MLVFRLLQALGSEDSHIPTFKLYGGVPSSLGFFFWRTVMLQLSGFYCKGGREGFL